MVTVEHAVGFMALSFVLVLVLAALGATRAQADLCQNVRNAARAFSVGSHHLDPSVEITGSAGANGVFSAVGTAPAVSVGSMSFGSLRCEVAGWREQTIWGSSER